MKRLTEKHYGADDYYMKCSEECERDHCIDCPAFEALVNCLGTYEDTGLSPKGMEAIKLSFMGKAVAEIKEFNDLPIDRLKELASADKEGRVVVLPCKVGGMAIYQNFEENPALMKNIRLEIAYESRCGVIFRMGCGIFADLVKHGRIKPVSEEG